jgi:hypothetical protein
MEPVIERLKEIKGELIKEGEVNGYNTTVEYGKKMKAIDTQIKRVMGEQVEQVEEVKPVKSGKHKGKKK